MTESDWFVHTSPTILMNTLDPQRYDRKLRLFVVACCRMVWERLPEPAVRWVIEASELYADDSSTFDELRRSVDQLHRLPWDQPRLLALHAAAVRCRTYADRRREYISAIATVYPYHAGFNHGDAIWRECNPHEIVIDRPQQAMTAVLRDIVDNPFRLAPFDSSWRTAAALGLANGIYNSRDFAALPVLADEFQEAGCEDDRILSHLRGPGPHARGCWVLDAVLGKG